MKYKGQLMEKGVEFVLALVFIGILLGAGILGVGALGTSLTHQYGTNTSAYSYAQAAAVNSVANATYSLLTFSTQLGTVGTISAVGLIIFVLVGIMAVAYVFVARS